VAVAVGPILSGAVIDAVGPEWGWRAAFAINVPLGLVALGLALRWLPFEAERLRRQGRALGVRPPRADLDPLGAGLISLAVLCLMTPFIVRGSPLLWLLLPAGLLLLVVWALWERRYVELGREPMVRMDLFLHRSFSVQTAVAAVQFLGGASVMAVLAIFLQQSLGATALATGLVTLPNAIASAATSVWAGRHALTRGRSIIVAALATNVIGLGLTGALAPLVTGGTLHYLWLAAPLTLSGAAFGAFGSINQTLALQDVPIRNGGSAGAVKQTAERTSAAMGNAIVTGLFFAVAAAAGQTVAFVASFGLVAVFMSAALAIAASDLRSGRRA